MNRVAGMVINGNTAAGVVLERDGAGWCLRHVAQGPLDTFSWPGCPVILDAAAFWENAERRHAGTTLTDAEMLRAAGWDVRPPRWEGGRAANPSDAEMVKNTWPLGIERAGALLDDATMTTAFLLAAWGATHPTSAVPPVEHVNRGPGATHNAAGTCCMPALRSEDEPPRHQDDALAYVPDDLAGLARREAGSVMHPTGACTCGGERACAWCMFDGVRRQRDEAERLLLALCGSTGPCAGDLQAARVYLAGRGLLPTEGA